MSILYFSPMLLGLNLLLAVAVAATALWAMTRPEPGPGFWMAGAWTLIVGVLFFLAFMITGSRVANVVGNALQLAGEALLILGVFRFMGRRLPYWLLPTAILVMVGFNLHYWLRDGNSDFLMGVYSTIAGLLPLQAIVLLLRSRVEPATRPARMLVAVCLLIYSGVTLWRGALGYYEAWAGLPYQMPNESFSYLLPYNLAIPALVMGFVGMTLMTMQRILADSQRNARDASDSAARFQRLLRVSSAGIALLDQGRITDCNSRLETISGRDRKSLLGLPVEQLFAPEEQEQLLYLLSDGVVRDPIELQVQDRDGREFAGEVSVALLGDGEQGSHLLELRDVSYRKRMESELKRLTRVDRLSGALTRRALYERLGLELARAEEQQTALALAFLELEHVRQISESEGQQAADEALRAFSVQCQQEIGNIDALARTGDETFALLMPDTDAAGAMLKVGRLLEKFGAGQGGHAELLVRGRIHTGIAVRESGDNRQALLLRAERALQQAKNPVAEQSGPLL